VYRSRRGVAHIAAGYVPSGAHAVELAALRANVRASVDQLRHGSVIIEHLIANDGLVVTGAWYSLETGKVEFLEELLPA
jgi:carbonic anhydrase